MDHHHFASMVTSLEKIGKMLGGIEKAQKKLQESRRMLDQVAAPHNLTRALYHCRRGKRESIGYQKFLLGMPENLLEISQDLMSQSYQWLPYRPFWVCDPKRRLILAAPFRDRIVHQALYQVIGPILDREIPGNSYACRKGMGNHAAARALATILRNLGPERWTIKLDVSQYFFSIDHRVLLSMIEPLLEAPILPLVHSLLKSHPDYGQVGRGLPIGNVTSQVFAKLFLSPADREGLAYGDIHYLRYMDDMVITGPSKAAVTQAARAIVDLVEKRLRLSIPYTKRVCLGRDPVPFLGYVIDHQGVRPLARNLRRHRRQMRKMVKADASDSKMAKAEISFAAWSTMGKKPIYIAVPNQVS